MIPRLLLLLGLIFIVVHPSVTSQAATQSSDLLETEGAYRIDVIAYSFNFTIIDLNKVDVLVNSGWKLEAARDNASVNSPIKHLIYGRPIEINARSGDVEHGLLIDELGINFDLIPPQAGQQYGPEKTKSTLLPNLDITIDAICNVYCGVGHSQMRFELEVGNGSSFGQSQIVIFGDWRVWLLFGLFAGATVIVIIIAVIKPRNSKTEDVEE